MLSEYGKIIYITHNYHILSHYKSFNMDERKKLDYLDLISQYYRLKKMIKNKITEINSEQDFKDLLKQIFILININLKRNLSKKESKKLKTFMKLKGDYLLKLENSVLKLSEINNKDFKVGLRKEFEIELNYLISQNIIEIINNNITFTKSLLL